MAALHEFDLDFEVAVQVWFAFNGLEVADAATRPVDPLVWDRAYRVTDRVLGGSLCHHGMKSQRRR